LAFFDCLTGFTLAKCQFPGRNVIFVFILLRERGFHCDEMRLGAQDRLGRLMAVVWAAARFLWPLSLTLPQEAWRWLRRLGGKTNEPWCDCPLCLFPYDLAALLRAYVVQRRGAEHEQRQGAGAVP